MNIFCGDNPTHCSLKILFYLRKKKKRKNINKTATVYYILRPNSIEVLSFMKAFTWKNSKV